MYDSNNQQKEPLRLKQVVRTYTLTQLRSNKFNRTHTAKSLGIGIRTLQRKLKLYGYEKIFSVDDEKAYFPALSRTEILDPVSNS